MSKYDGVQIFCNMKTYIFLILGFIHIVSSQFKNITGHHDCNSECTVNLFRRKRAIIEYTRWQANYETTPEFIVQVLDEDVTTPNTNKVVAVNILPEANRGEKIIVGGAMVPPHTSTVSEVTPREYTRFVPPTTVPPTIFLAPISPAIAENIPPIKPGAAINALRDESPPASPQFLARSPPAFARQFAPIGAVAFTRKPVSISEFTQQYEDEEKNLVVPLRTTLRGNLPRRTTDEYPKFNPFHRSEIELEPDNPTRTFLQDIVTRTTLKTTTEEIFQDEYFKSPKIKEFTTSTKTEIDVRKFEAISDILDKVDLSDNDVPEKKEEEVSFTNELMNNRDDNIVSKKSETELAGDYEDKEKEHEEHDFMDTETDDIPTKKANETPDITNVKEVEITPFPNIVMSDTDIMETEKTTEEPQITQIDTQNDGRRGEQKIESSQSKVRRQICNLIKLRQLNFNSPRTLPEIVAQLKQWAENSPVAKWSDITEGNLTVMENPIYMMIVDDPTSGQIASAKQTVMVVAGIQGRDHHAVAAAMYLLYQLIERSEAHSDLLTKYRFWVVPVFNPDGYDYSMTFPQRREWTKNLRQNWDSCKGRDFCLACATYGLRCNIQPCYGVNLDRNFEYQWIPTEELRSEHPCGSLYAGARQLSEAETRALTQYLHNQRLPLFTFIAFKEGDVLGVMYPYSHTRKKRAFDHVYRQRASRAASAAYSISGRPYVAGQTSEFLPLYAGGIEDWVDGHLGIDNTYTIMIFRPTDSYNSKLITERVVHEAYAAMDTLLLQSAEPLSPQVAPVMTRLARAEARRVLPSLLATLPLTILTKVICS